MLVMDLFWGVPWQKTSPMETVTASVPSVNVAKPKRRLAIT
jgi:hypothetical protein